MYVILWAILGDYPHFKRPKFWLRGHTQLVTEPDDLNFSSHHHLCKEKTLGTIAVSFWADSCIHYALFPLLVVLNLGST